ncbi:MAG: hypothetical protein KDA37_15735, partial [Planctomycetales bacterium]|nr:hypothetical protein [Planctomycetales bacterium]
MRILACHNYYKIRGGEDQSFEDEVALLRSAGHEVETYTRHNDEVDQMSQLAAAAQTLYGRNATRDLGALAHRFRPQIVHFTNT